jgi:hypothetical protein
LFRNAEKMERLVLDLSLKAWIIRREPGGLHQNLREVGMGPSIEYQKIISEIVFINLPGPAEPAPGMSGGELVHGFLADLYNVRDPDFQQQLAVLCLKWNIHYRRKS